MKIMLNNIFFFENILLCKKQWLFLYHESMRDLGYQGLFR